MRVLCNSKGIETAIKTFRDGKTLVFPTDTVYGVGCNPYDKNAVKTIYNIKNRQPTKLMPILGYSKRELEKIVFFDEKSDKIAERFWPGPVTLLLKLKDEKLKESLSVDEKIAVRVPDNSCILSILKECKLIIGTSANVSGSPSYKNPNECSKNFTGYDLFIDGGVIQSKGESTIIENDNGLRVIRAGAIPEEEIFSIF